MSHDNPGLDLTALRALRGRQRPTTALLDRIGAHLDQHDGYVAFSGGKDSAVPIAWFDSGLELPETRSYIEQLAHQWRLNLTVIPAEPTLLQLLIASGAWDHNADPARVPSLGHILIDQPAQEAHQSFGAGELWGVRAQESTGRRQMYATQFRREIRRTCNGCCPANPSGTPTSAQRRTHGGVIRRTDGTTAYGPIWDWSTNQVWEYLAAHRIPVNPVYAKLSRLGVPQTAMRISTVLDGAHLEHGRVTWLRRGWPQLYAQLLPLLPRLAEHV